MLQSVLSVFGQTYYTYDTPSSTGGTGSAVGALIAMIVGLAIVVFVVAGMWKVFTKAGQPGWKVLIPFYNTYTLLKIVNRPGWWLLILLFIPIADLILGIVVANDLAKSFGKGVGMTVALVIVPFIAMPILGFGNAKYHGGGTPGAGAAPAGSPPASV